MQNRVYVIGIERSEPDSIRGVYGKSSVTCRIYRRLRWEWSMKVWRQPRGRGAAGNERV